MAKHGNRCKSKRRPARALLRFVGVRGRSVLRYWFEIRQRVVAFRGQFTRFFDPPKRENQRAFDAADGRFWLVTEALFLTK